jgi:hypothetical protein
VFRQSGQHLLPGDAGSPDNCNWNSHFVASVAQASSLRLSKNEIVAIQVITEPRYRRGLGA